MSEGGTRYRFIREVMPYLYADISLEFENAKPEIHIRTFKIMMMSALKSLFGDSGLAIPVDILKYDGQTYRAYIRFPAKDHVKVRSSLTLFSSWDLQKCAIRIHKVCHSLSYLTIDSSSHQRFNIVKYVIKGEDTMTEVKGEEESKETILTK